MKDKEVKGPDGIVCQNYSKTNEAFDFSSEKIDIMEDSIQMEEKIKYGTEFNPNTNSSHRIEWRNLSFEIDKRIIGYEAPFKVTLNHLQKQILKPQSGCIYSGQMTALMGPSGSGKTTLLNCITGRITGKGILSGEVNYIVKDSSRKRDKLLKLSYVPQKDHLYQDFTIRETLRYAYKFTDISNNKQSNEHSTKSRLEKLASDLNLLSALDTKISKCSGGQVKRVSVAIELVSSPNILILDEPTTGLDSMNASTIISVIKDLLSRRRLSQNYSNDDVNNNDNVVPAVICAIHQPSVEVFNLFDSIYVLSEGGINIFSGPPSKVPQMLAMNNINLGENATNPADFLLMLCQSKEKIKKLTAPLTEDNQNENQIVRSLSDAKKETDRSYSNSHYFKSVGHLLSRNIKLLRYNPSPILIRSLFCIISSMIMNGMYDHAIGSHDGCYDEVFGLSTGSNSNQSFSQLLLTNSASKSFHDSLKRAGQILDNVSFLLISTMFILEIHSLMTVIEVPTEIKIISKEVANHWYSINSYITSRLLITFVAMFVHISLFAGFAMLITSQLLQWNRYLYLATVWVLLAWISELTGFIFGVLFHNNLTSAILVTISHSFPVVFFGGFFVKSANTPIYFLPFTWISHMRHVFEALMITTYGLGRCSEKVKGKFSFAEILESSPMQLMSKVMEINNITHEASKYISPLLGLPDDFCVAQIINGTRDYLGLPSPYPTYESPNATEDYNYDDDGTDLMTDIAQEQSTKSSISTTDISFPLSLFGIEEKNFERCFYSLFIILIIYKIITLIVLRRLVRVTF